jgi:hypothetical protein
MLVDANQPHPTAAGVVSAIRQASRLTGTSFQYLLATAKVESNLDPRASAKTSSAGGLFQFIEQTWLSTLKEAGAAFGLGRYANAIEKTDSGYAVTDRVLREEVMKLRQDPGANAAMAGAFTRNNAEFLAQHLGREATEPELYLAHFLGARGAATLISAAQTTPNAIAAQSFPQAARANRIIFYHEGGRPKSFAEVARTLSQRYAIARAGVGEGEPALMAGNGPKAESAAVTNQVVRAYAAAAPEETPVRDYNYRNPYRDAKPARADRSAQANQSAPADKPAAARVREMWGLRPSIAAEPAKQAAAVGHRTEPLGLFQDMAPDVRALFTGGRSS